MTNPTNKEKWVISLWTLIAAFIVFNPLTFTLTNVFGMLSPELQTINNGKITILGWVLHYIVFFLLVRLMMQVTLPGTKD
jgi:hypothetical protein